MEFLDLIQSSIFKLAQRNTVIWTRHSLVHNDTDCIVEKTFTKDDGVQLGVNLVLIEDGQDCYWICG